MARGCHSAIRNGIEERLSPIPGGVKANCEPEISGAAQSQAKEEADESGGQQAGPMLLIIFQVNESEGAGKGQGSRPEAHAASQRELRVPAQQKFFEQSHQNEENAPECGKLRDPPAIQHDVAK